MRCVYAAALILFSNLSVFGQTFNGSGGAIPGSGSSPTCFNATVSGIGTIQTTKGLAQVCLSITHSSVDELEILLQAPDGTYVPLSIQNGNTGADNYTNTCFSATASTPIKFGTAPFSGTFLPEGHLGAVNNGQNADGIWKLCILDRRAPGTAGNLTSWSLTFSNNPAPQPPALPACSTTIPSTSDCASASSICDFNGACGSTTGSTKRSWTALDNASCFGLNNNSFVKFIADASTVSFSVWVTSSNNGFNNANGGIQMLFFSTPSCGGAVTTYGCYNRIYPYPTSGKPLISVIYAEGLTPGNTYYLLTDGANGDLCNFTIAANSGVSALNITPSSTDICLGETVTLNASGGNGTFSWSAITGGGNLLSTSGSSVSAKPNTAGTYTYRVSSVTGLGCPTTKDITINVVTPPAVPLINSVAASCTAAGTSTISNYSNTITYTFTPSGPTVGTGGLISGMTTGTSYTVTAKAGNCTSNASATFSNAAQLTSIATPTVTTTAATCSAAGTSTISNYNNTLTYAFTPSGPSVGSGGAISGMTTGTGYTVTASNGSCISLASNSFSNAAQLTTPATPAISSAAATCSAAGSSTITNYNATLTYSFTPVGPSAGAGGVIAGMTAGTGYTVTASNGSCISPASNSFSNAAQLSTPSAPNITSTAATCSAAGTSSISNYNNTLTYSFTPSGPSVGSGGAISGMTTGTGYTVTASNGSCISLASNSFSNAAQLTTPAAPAINITQPTCAMQTGNITVTAGAGLTYSIDGINYQSGNTFSALNPGNYSVTVKNAGGCISAVANATLTQPVCATDDLYVPNTFTPNGDGKNDIFLVRGTTIKNMQLLIFNQWGEKVFESNKQDQGWDGRSGGKPQPVGVYVYVLKTTLLSGQIKNLKGSITLIR